MSGRNRGYSSTISAEYAATRRIHRFMPSKRSKIDRG
jgi:hypothetical protein